MKKRIVYTNAPKDIAKSMMESMDDDDFVDFLPPPEELILKQSKENIPVDSQVVNHFKKYAQEHNKPLA
ncbi:MAG: hypothetical protein LBN20_05805 [Endomicrobium sp.]|nr:hypothetical protein [Endomicrobium sp.]